MSQGFDIVVATHDTRCLLCNRLIRAGENCLKDSDGDYYCTEEMSAVTEYFEAASEK